MPEDNARPVTCVLAPSVIAPAARIVPANEEFAPVPAAPATCQYTCEADAPLTEICKPKAAPPAAVVSQGDHAA